MHNLEDNAAPDEAKDEFELSMRLRNNRLKSRRLLLGVTVPELARRIGISAAAYRDLENLDRSALYKNGEWRGVALAVAMYFKVSPELLWPDSVLAVTQPKITKTISNEKLLAIAAVQPGLLLGAAPSDPEAAYEGEELEDATRRVLLSLSPREEKVLRMRFGIGEKGEHTCEEIGKDFEVSKDRIRQIESKALRKLREPYRTKHLKEFAPDAPGVVWSALIDDKRFIGFRTQTQAYETWAANARANETARFGVSLSAEIKDVRPRPVAIAHVQNVERVIKCLWHDLVPGRTYFIHWMMTRESVEKTGMMQMTVHNAKSRKRNP